MNTHGTGRDFWAALYVPPPPAEAACKGASPYLFELRTATYNGTGINVMKHRDGDESVSPRFESQVTVALGYCATCPLATRQWCLDTVRPREGHFSGIAGGAVFSNGRRVWDLRRQGLRPVDGAA